MSFLPKERGGILSFEKKLENQKSGDITWYIYVSTAGIDSKKIENLEIQNFGIFKFLDFWSYWTYSRPDISKVKRCDIDFFQITLWSSSGAFVWYTDHWNPSTNHREILDSKTPNFWRFFILFRLDLVTIDLDLRYTLSSRSGRCFTFSSEYTCVYAAGCLVGSSRPVPNTRLLEPRLTIPRMFYDF